ncbi:MAG TPA: LacI family DNA-binding transcriptional regulator [Armatimonadota bacterium]|nr:LacI family DNA-binding transcriptional regulator [Armatimonadota bacterium]
MPTEQTPKTIVSMKDIADRCGVSVMTVSRALGNKGRISPETAGHIRAVAVEMGYDASTQQVARRLTQRRTGIRVPNDLVGLCYPEQFYNTNYFLAIFEGIMEIFTAEKIGVLISYTYSPLSNSKNKFFLPNSYMHGDADGVLVIAKTDWLNGIVSTLRATANFASRPIISMMKKHPGCSSVRADDAAGTLAIVNHLLDLGHRHIGYIHEELDEPYHSRASIYRKAFHEYGLNPDHYLHKVDLDIAVPADRRLIAPIQKTLEQFPAITALITNHDQQALLAREIVEKLGKRVPDDFSVTGFDDSEVMLDQQGHNILTTVCVPLVDIGREAARLMLRRISGDEEQDTDIVLPTSLVVRGSTAPPPR